MTGFDDYYELRIYRCIQGRLPDLHHRMGREILPLFEKHGVARPLGYWEGHAGPFAPAYVYLQQWKSLDERFAAFGNFYRDPDCIALLNASNAGEDMIDRLDLMIMRPSLAWKGHRKSGTPVAVGGLHELGMVSLNTQNSKEGQRVFGELDLPYLADRGAEILGVFQVWFGWNTPQLVYFLAWESFEQREEAILAYQRDTAISAQRMDERQRYGGPLHFAGDTLLLDPAHYGTPMTGFAVRP